MHRSKSTLRIIAMLATLAVGSLLFVSLAAAKTSAKPKFTAAQLAAGKKIFKSNCGSCHTLKQAATHGTTGPNLNSIHPTLGAIVTQVTSGGRFMPPFGASAGGALSTTQVKNVAAFVYTSDH